MCCAVQFLLMLNFMLAIVVDSYGIAFPFPLFFCFDFYLMRAIVVDSYGPLSG